MTVTERIKRSAEAREKARQEKNRYKARALTAERQLADLLAALVDATNDLEEIYQKRQPRIDYKVKGVADRLSAAIARTEKTRP